MSDLIADELPYSISQETLSIMGVDLVVHVLNTGQRIIEAEGMAALFEAMGAGTLSGEDSMKLAKVIRTA